MGKRGRKSRAGKREPNGRLSRQIEDVVTRLGEDRILADQQERATVAPAIVARSRVFGVPVAIGLDQRAGTFVGRLRMADELTLHQYIAAELYRDQCEVYAFAMAAPRQPGAIDLNATRGTTNTENVEASQRACSQYEKALEAVTAAQNKLRLRANLYGALNLCVVQDRELPHLVDDLRLALNALVKHYGLGKKAKRLDVTPEPA